MEEIIYLGIVQALQSAEAITFFESKGLKPIATVDLFNNQYLYEKEEVAYELPAVFVEFAPAQYAARGRNTEEVTDLVRIHVEQKTLASSASYSPDQDKSLAILKTIQTVHELLAFTIIQGVGKFNRVGRMIDADHGNAPVHIWEYLLVYLDQTTERYPDSSAEDAVDLQVTKQLKSEIKPD